MDVEEFITKLRELYQYTQDSNIPHEFFETILERTYAECSETIKTIEYIVRSSKKKWH